MNTGNSYIREQRRRPSNSNSRAGRTRGAAAEARSALTADGALTGGAARAPTGASIYGTALSGCTGILAVARCTGILVVLVPARGRHEAAPAVHVREVAARQSGAGSEAVIVSRG